MNSLQDYQHWRRQNVVLKLRNETLSGIQDSFSIRLLALKKKKRTCPSWTMKWCLEKNTGVGSSYYYQQTEQGSKSPVGTNVRASHAQQRGTTRDSNCLHKLSLVRATDVCQSEFACESNRCLSAKRLLSNDWALPFWTANMTVVSGAGALCHNGKPLTSVTVIKTH